VISDYPDLFPAGIEQGLNSIQNELELFIEAGRKPGLQGMAQSVKFAKFRPPPGTRFTRGTGLRRIKYLITGFA
jgi:hypothetical protein